MHIRAPAILLAVRQHGETAVIARLLTEEHGVVAGYVAGGRGRRMRPVAIPGNRVELQLSARSEHQLPFIRIELVASRGAWLGEPLVVAAIGWSCALTAAAVPERQPYPALYRALGALLEAICHAPSARGWAGALASYEALLIRELGYGAPAVVAEGRSPGEQGAGMAQTLAILERIGPVLDRYLLADRRGDVMAARSRLREMLGRMT